MAIKKIDHAGRLSVYERLSKQRPLTDEEIDIVIDLNKKVRRQAQDEAYRNRNREKIRQKNYRLSLCPIRIARGKELAKRRRANGSDSSRRASAKYTAAHPERVKAKYKKQQQRIKDIRAVERNAGAYTNASKIEFWKRTSAERELNQYEQTRLKSLERLSDPNGEHRKAVQAKNKRQWQKTLAKRQEKEQSSGKDPCVSD